MPLDYNDTESAIGHPRPRGSLCGCSTPKMRVTQSAARDKDPKSALTASELLNREMLGFETQTELW